MGWRGPLGSIGEHAKKRRRGGASEQGCPKTGSGGAASLEAGEFAGETWRGQGAEDHWGRNEVEKTRWGGGAVQTASPLSRITEQGVLVEDVDFQPLRAEGCVLGTPPARVLEPEEPSGLSLGGRACLSLSVTACEQLSRVLLVSLNQESLDTQSSQHRPETRPAACIPHPRLARSDGASGAAPEDAAIPSGHRLVFTSLSTQL